MSPVYFSRESHATDLKSRYLISRWIKHLHLSLGNVPTYNYRSAWNDFPIIIWNSPKKHRHLGLYWITVSNLYPSYFSLILPLLMRFSVMFVCLSAGLWNWFPRFPYPCVRNLLCVGTQYGTKCSWENCTLWVSWLRLGSTSNFWLFSRQCSGKSYS